MKSKFRSNPIAPIRKNFLLISSEAQKDVLAQMSRYADEVSDRKIKKFWTEFRDYLESLTVKEMAIGE